MECQLLRVADQWFRSIATAPPRTFMNYKLGRVIRK
jgi:hypothetical protein